MSHRFEQCESLEKCLVVREGFLEVMSQLNRNTNVTSGDARQVPRTCKEVLGNDYSQEDSSREMLTGREIESLSCNQANSCPHTAGSLRLVCWEGEWATAS